jgi:hypothetical protein
VRALNFEPDNRMHGSMGGDWKRDAMASPRQPPTQPTSDGDATAERWVPLLIVGPKVVGEKPGYSAPLLWVEIREIRWERRPNGSGMQSDRCIDIRRRDDHIAHAAAGAPR